MSDVYTDLKQLAPVAPAHPAPPYVALPPESARFALLEID